MLGVNAVNAQANAIGAVSRPTSSAERGEVVVQIPGDLVGILRVEREE